MASAAAAKPPSQRAFAADHDEADAGRDSDGERGED
jgi:hypothetical protein